MEANASLEDAASRNKRLLAHIQSQALFLLGISPSPNEITQRLSAFVEAGDATKTARRTFVLQSTTDSGLAAFDAAMLMADEEIVDLAMEAIQYSLQHPQKGGQPRAPLDPATTNNAAKFRFTAYQRLAALLGFNGLSPPQRVPLPALAEVLVKVVFPQTDADDYTYFKPRVLEGAPSDVLGDVNANADLGEASQAAGEPPAKRLKIAVASMGSQTL